MKKNRFSEYIKSFDFKNLFNELGWDNFGNNLPIAVYEETFLLGGIVEKKGFVILHCPAMPNGKIPLSNVRKQIEAKVAKHYFEHLIIYSDQSQTHQIWQIAIKEENKPKQVREISWYSHQDTEILFQRLKNLLFTLDEEEQITIVDVKQRISENFAKNTESVTKKFYTEFKKQHTVFLDFIQGIDDHIANKENTNKQWYASLMLNRLMFCYFIQKKGFLDQDVHYLGNKLNESKLHAGKDNFYSFYRSFLLELFHDGLGKPEKHRHEHPIDLGKIPYLNGGLFDVHELEKQFEEINISDDAFNALFNFFDQWNWHLDNSIEATGRDINPDVIGYIFEKYINDRAAMGAYYTKEDITDYIGKNTIIPFLFDETERNYKQGFTSDSELWSSLRQSGDTYIYDAVKKGVPKNGEVFADLPEEIKIGFRPNLEKEIVKENTTPHLWEIRKIWNTKAPEDIALPTELYRELIERRKRFTEIKSKIENGEIGHINDFITYNLNIRQFTQDFIENTNDPDFIKAFFNAIKKITILDPTCGSGAFLFAALNILEPLYEACIQRIEFFVHEAGELSNAANLNDVQKKSWQSINHEKSWFRQQLADINSEQHPNLQYYIFKNIILNNLYGVDIMKEAVEIAKLRLFLKLVATVDVNPRKANYGLEPLPDIDFNVRAGNTLIGFATEKELLSTIEKKEGLFAQDKLDEFKEDCALASKAYSHFQNAQLVNDQGSDSFKKAKADLNGRLNTLNHKLNLYLATNYGITDAEGKQKDKYDNWLTTHQPFHWFAEFYQIVAGNGGFDCIIGNPPYVEYSTIRKNYTITETRILGSGNLYTFVIDRSLLVQRNHGYNGMIIPISAYCTARMGVFQKLEIENTETLYVSNYAERPSKLFEGAERNLSIAVFKKLDDSKQCKIYSTYYYKWNAEHRNLLFESLSYQEGTETILDNIIQKVSSPEEVSILKKLHRIKSTIGHHTIKSKSNNILYYRNSGGRYWKIMTSFQPKFILNNVNSVSSRESYLYFSNEDELKNALANLNSTLYFWYYVMHSDARTNNPSDLKNFPYAHQSFAQSHLKKLKELCTEFMKDMNNNAVLKEAKYKTGDIQFQQFFPIRSKPIIDQIDTVLAQHYGFTEEELDFIINYDIKYRMGKALFGEEENGEDED